MQAFPNGGSVFPVSTGPSTEAVWSRSGRELFYRNAAQMWVVEVDAEPVFRTGSPRVLFDTPYELDSVGVPNYDVSLDGQQFLMARSDDAEDSAGLVVVQNWGEELTRLVPADR